MHDASVNSEPGSNSPLEFVTFKSQAVQRQLIANKSCWLLTLLTWINLVSYYSLWLTFWAFKMLGFNLPISNRPFAHCCQIFTERNFLVALFLLRKKQSEIYFLLWALFGYKDILANLFQSVKPFLNFRLKRSTLTTLLFKHFFISLSNLFLS